MTDTKQICEAIKGFPEGEYLVGEFPGNGDDDNHVTTNQLKALVAENEALKEMLADVMLVEGKAWSISDNGNPAKLIALRQYDDEGNLLSYTHHNSVLEALTILAAHGGNDD